MLCCKLLKQILLLLLYCFPGCGAFLQCVTDSRRIVLLHQDESKAASYFKETNKRPGFGSVNLKDEAIAEEVGDDEDGSCVSSMCSDSLCVCICVCVIVQIPVVFVGEVVDNGETDAGHAPLAVVPSSCDDRQLRSAEALLAGCAQGGQRMRRGVKRNVHSVEQPKRVYSAVATERSTFL